MRIDIVPVGNSKGIRIPKPVLQQCHIEKSVDMEVKGGHIILTPESETPRKGWDKAFKRMHRNKDDGLIINDSLDREDWEWK
ncbi:MAG: peptidase [Elusimicrobia bacterium RIFOXYB2_FULL_49_7]|nr:MAG: peptidase [Elusimicrobia bacterium RIFOXYB2_FULL_49_7]